MLSARKKSKAADMDNDMKKVIYNALCFTVSPLSILRTGSRFVPFFCMYLMPLFIIRSYFADIEHLKTHYELRQQNI